MKKAIAIVGLMACALPAWAAEGPSYNYVQANWIFDSELDAGGGASVDGDGFDIAGSFSVNEFFYVLGEYNDLSYDGGLDLSEISAGVGVHSNTYTGGIDVFGNLTYEDIELDVPGLGSADDNGFGAEIGARAMLGAAFDAYISYKYEDISDVEGNFFKLGGAWAFTPNWAAIAQYRTGEYEAGSADLDRDDIRVGVRYNF